MSWQLFLDLSTFKTCYLLTVFLYIISDDFLLALQLSNIVFVTNVSTEKKPKTQNQHAMRLHWQSTLA